MGKQQQRQEARQIANRMADQGKSAAQIAQRIENKTNVSSSAAQNIASRAATPPSNTSGSQGSSIAGVQVGAKLNVGEVNKLLDKGLTLQQIQNRAENKDIRVAPGARSALNPSPSPSTNEDGAKKDDIESILSGWANTYFGGGAPGEEQIPFSEYSLYPDVLSNQASLEAERVRQAGATERLKYEVDNKIPQIQAEAKGKIDLQQIVNAGYKNIANIERGTEMVRNITSMFNF